MSIIFTTDGRPWVRPPPENYDELRLWARQQLENRIGWLEERAEQLQRFLDDFDNAESPDEIEELAKLTGTWYDDDHMVDAVEELTTHWPGIKSAPGEGYW